MNWYDFEFRTYDPQLGRWWQADPLMQHASSYLAMSNNPVLFTDPLGLWDDDVYGNDDDPIKGKLLREVVVYAQRPSTRITHLNFVMRAKRPKKLAVSRARHNESL